MIPEHKQDLTLDVVIISWQGHGEKALHIARCLEGQPHLRLSVIYSNAGETAESGPGRWLQVPNSAYFGAKFAKALAEFDGGALVIIQADATSEDWPGLMARCHERFCNLPELGVWAPRVDYTPWLPQRVDIGPPRPDGLTAVAHTDGIVLAFSASVMQRLRQLDYRGNNIGWGIDWIAICHCYSQGLAVLREDGFTIGHPPSRGYDTREATRQWLAFMQQMPAAEQAMFEILKRYTAEPRGFLAKMKRSLRKSRAGARVRQGAAR